MPTDSTFRVTSFSRGVSPERKIRSLATDRVVPVSRATACRACSWMPDGELATALVSAPAACSATSMNPPIPCRLARLAAAAAWAASPAALVAPAALRYASSASSSLPKSSSNVRAIRRRAQAASDVPGYLATSFRQSAIAASNCFFW